MSAPKKATAAPAPAKEPETEPATEETHNTRKVPLEAEQRVESESWTAFGTERTGNLTINIAPVGWVGDAPLVTTLVKVEELRDLLNKVLGE